MTWKGLLAWGTGMLQAAEIGDAVLDAWYLLEHISHMDRAGYFLHQGEEASREACREYEGLIRRRGDHVPLQYLTGTQEFMGFSFQVSPAVLIPRQDTERLVEIVLPLCGGKSVLDLCTGSGCIAISLAKLGHPECMVASDISEAALQVAGENARRLDASVIFVQSDLYGSITGIYDVIVSNPPYIMSGVLGTLMPEVRAHEPEIALDGGKDGLALYRRITGGAAGRLRIGGILAVEIGFDQRDAVTGLFRESGFTHVTCYKDLCGLDRVVTGVYEPDGRK